MHYSSIIGSKSTILTNEAATKIDQIVKINGRIYKIIKDNSLPKELTDHHQKLSKTGDLEKTKSTNTPSLSKKISKDLLKIILDNLSRKDIGKIAQTSKEIYPTAIKSRFIQEINILNKNYSFKDLGYKNVNDVITYLEKFEKLCKSSKDKLPKLTRLDLDGLRVSDEDFKNILKKCPHLQQLYTSSGNITNAAIEHIKDIPLQHLNLGGCRNLTDAAIKHIKDMPLQHLNLRGCRNLTDAAIEHIKDMPLQHLNLRECKNLTDNGIEHIKNMPLQYLNLSRCRNLTGAAIKHIKDMPLLKHLNLESTDLTGAAIKHIKDIPLQYLNLSKCRNLTDAAIEHIKNMPIQYLNLSKCRGLTDAAIEHIKNMPLIHYLNLESTNITDNAIEYIKNTPLQYLNLSRCRNLTDAAINHIKNMPLLKRLNLESTNLHLLQYLEKRGYILTDAAIEELKTHNPQIKIN